MSQELNWLVDEIVKKVRDRLLEQGLKFNESDVRREAANLSRSVTSTNSNEGPRIKDHYSAEEIASTIDHTLLKADATEKDLVKLCAEATKYKFASVCVNSSYIPRVAELLKGSSVKPIAVVGFPLGAATSTAKAFEAKEAIKAGALEIDMVLNIGELKSGNYLYVLQDIHTVVEASKPYPVKVILETSLLDHEQKVIACALSKAANAAFVKTSTGFSTGGATVEDIRLMRRLVGNAMGVKASGGVRTLQDALDMLQAGASRIGASASAAIVEEAQKGGAQNGATQHSGHSGSNKENQKGRTPFTGLPYKAADKSSGKSANKSSDKPQTNPPTNTKKSGGY